MTNLGNLGGLSTDLVGWSTGTNIVTHSLSGVLVGTGPVALADTANCAAL